MLYIAATIEWEWGKNKVVYVSVTGLKTKGFMSWIRFWMLAIPAFRAAQKAEVNWEIIRFCIIKIIFYKKKHKQDLYETNASYALILLLWWSILHAFWYFF